MKLKAVHTYQYVRFQNKNENFLSAGNSSMPDLKLELLTVGGVGLVRATTAKDSIIIFPTNIAYAIEETSENKTEKVATRGKLLDNDPSSPRK